MLDEHKIMGKKLLFGYDGCFKLTPNIGKRKLVLDAADEYAVEMDRIDVEQVRDYLNSFLRKTK